jgi:hypothetical protein
MTLVMEQDESPNPLHIRFFRTEAVMSDAYGVTNLLKQIGLSVLPGCLADVEYTSSLSKENI